MDDLNEWEYAIARSLVKFASLKRRTNYPEVAADIGWHHEQGRGMGKSLDAILNYCHEKGYPALTTILVKKGTHIPPEDAVEQIKAVLGDIEIKETQKDVFEFEWSNLEEFKLSVRSFRMIENIGLLLFGVFHLKIGAALGLIPKPEGRNL